MYKETLALNNQQGELKLYRFELDHISAEAIKYVCFVKREGTVDHSIVTRLLKKFHLGFKNFNDQAKSARPKTVDSEAVLYAMEENQASCIRRVSVEIGIS